jgi:hypothetical protein
MAWIKRSREGGRGASDLREGRRARRWSLALGVGMMGLVFWLAASAQETEESWWQHDYVGAERCQSCHGGIHEAWENAVHAKTFDGLPARAKKEPWCISCHTTGMLDDGTLLEGIQCEACHGPGSSYASDGLMSDTEWDEDPEGQRERLRRAGLVLPTEATCSNSHCHVKEDNPCYVVLDFEKRKERMHPVAADRARSGPYRLGEQPEHEPPVIW